VDRGALGDPELADRDSQAGERTVAFIERAGEAQEQQRRGLGFEREVGEDALHGGLIDQRFSKAWRWRA